MFGGHLNFTKYLFINVGVYEVKHFYYVRLSFIKKKLPFLVSISLNFEVHIRSCHIKNTYYKSGQCFLLNWKKKGD